MSEEEHYTGFVMAHISLELGRIAYLDPVNISTGFCIHGAALFYVFGWLPFLSDDVSRDTIFLLHICSHSMSCHDLKPWSPNHGQLHVKITFLGMGRQW